MPLLDLDYDLGYLGEGNNKEQGRDRVAAEGALTSS